MALAGSAGWKQTVGFFPDFRALMMPFKRGISTASLLGVVQQTGCAHLSAAPPIGTCVPILRREPRPGDSGTMRPALTGTSDAPRTFPFLRQISRRRALAALREARAAA